MSLQQMWSKHTITSQPVLSCVMDLFRNACAKLEQELGSKKSELASTHTIAKRTRRAKGQWNGVNERLKDNIAKVEAHLLLIHSEMRQRLTVSHFHARATGEMLFADELKNYIDRFELTFADDGTEPRPDQQCLTATEVEGFMELDNMMNDLKVRSLYDSAEGDGVRPTARIKRGKPRITFWEILDLSENGRSEVAVSQLQSELSAAAAAAASYAPYQDQLQPRSRRSASALARTLWNSPGEQPAITWCSLAILLALIVHIFHAHLRDSGNGSQNVRSGVEVVQIAFTRWLEKH